MQLYKELKLGGNKGLVTKLDTEDYEVFSKEKWNCSGCAKPGVFYASKMVNLGKIDGKYRYRKRAIHREIMNAKSGQIVDHINGDTLDNRRSNLRLVTLHQSMQNRRGSSSKSAPKGGKISKRGKVNAG